ncbi:MAG: T9SS type A sorting domain-containing protein [Bacteroidales bacterium]|nr:T9SS type A sorting domain-containing protein [Bacteroidales bacterium]
MLKIRLLIIVFLLFGVKSLIGCSVCSYFYAYGTEELHVYWDYYSDNPEELLGCNLFRYEDDPTQSYQVNQELITSEDKDYYFLDTFNIIDTTIYFYMVEFIFPNDTLYCDLHAGSFKNVEFNVVNFSTIELIAEPKKAGDFMVNVYRCDEGTSFWSVIASFNFENIFITQLENQIPPTNYYMYTFFDFIGNDYGNILTSHAHINQLLLIQTPEYNSSAILITNFPNPFNETTQINLSIINGDFYRIGIFSNRGELVRTIVNSRLNAGDFSFTWDRKNDAGIKVENGLYYCTVNSGKTKQTIKLLVQ